MMMSGPDLVSMAEAIRGLRSFMLIRSTVTSTPASFANSAASRLNSTSEAGTKLTHSRMLSFVPFGKLGAFCAATISGIPPTAAAPVAAPPALRNARRSSLATPPGCIAMVHPRRTGPFPTPGPAGDRPRPAHPRPSPAKEAIRAPPIDRVKRSSSKLEPRWRAPGVPATMVVRLAGVECLRALHDCQSAPLAPPTS